MPKKPQSREMWANRDFFAKPSGVAKLVRDKGALFHFKVPVVVTAISERKDADLDLVLATALGEYKAKYGKTALEDFMRGYLGCVLY